MRRQLLGLLVGLLVGVSVEAAERSTAQVRAFRKQHPCPATQRTTGACPGWVVDHLIPLCAGGADHPANMQWSTRAEGLLKDRWERTLCARLRAERAARAATP